MKTNRPFIARAALACLFAVSTCLNAAAIFTPNNMPTGWVGEIDVSSFDFTDGSQVIFKGDYIKGEWSGNVLAFPVDFDGTVLFTADKWSGGLQARLDGKLHTERFIGTMKSDGSKIPFRWLSLGTTQATAIDSSKSQATSVIGPNVINYVRGDRSNETPLGVLYRARKHLLGDVIHSRPLFVDHGTVQRVYVGANDGMLHSIDAETGAEVFAYVPSFFISPIATTNFSNIKALTVNPYVHNYFVDASPNAASVTLSGGITNVLVGGVGAGGKGLYALNISDPTAPTDDAGAASKIMWEITPTTINNVTSTSYSQLGYTYGIPVIGKAPDGAWVAIVGNGYNNQGLNQAVLYVINLADGTLKAAISTSSPQAVSDANPNGLSSPTAIDTNYDGKIDYVYAGDINGNLWKFNLATMTVARLYTTNPAQPITGRPAVSLHPLGGYMVNFATGRMFTSADATDTTAYYAYGIRDNGTLPIPTDTNIVSQTLIPKTWTATGGFNYAVRVSSSNAVDYAAGKQGWKLQLPAGERVVGDGGLVTNRRFIFASTNPTIAHPPTGVVEHPQGDNWLNEVDFTTGGGGTSPQFDLDANYTLDDDDRVRDSGGTAAQAGATGIPVSRYIVPGVMSQPIVARLKTLSQTYFNTNPDYVSSPSTPGNPGVSDGHFDFDIYYGTCTVGSKYSCKTDTHVHEYDDKYNVTGVNMLNPSLPAFNLLNAIPSKNTQFKILMSNQKYSPAVKFLVGGATGVPVTSYETTAGLTMASRTTYTRGTDAVPATVDLGSLIVALPLDAFQSKDWAGTGDVRAGLVPTQTGCVHENQGAGTTGTGPWMNGALTIQVVKATTPESAVELNIPGDPTMGYRLKKDNTSQLNQLAQYTIFWHHPNNKCVGDAGWVKNPPQDPDGTTSSTSHGGDDPADGAFGTIGGVAPSGGGGVAGPTSTITYTFADGSTVMQTTTTNDDGSLTITRTWTDGTTTTHVIPPNSGGDQADTRAKTGRVSWREMIRP